jgi:ADP-ribosyl-[dinitrogen reductase] hydrolase
MFADMSAPTAESQALPLRHCYWVVPGLLLAGEHPNGPTRDKTKERLKKLLGAGIECFVDLTKATELLRYDTFLPFHVEYTRKSIKDHGLPDGPAQMSEILGYIARSMRAGRPVYVHCRAGIGRTGTVVGCFLAERGMRGNEAIDELNRLWQQSRRSRSWPFIPETEAQAQFVRQWTPTLDGGFELSSLATAVATVGPMTTDGGLLGGMVGVAEANVRSRSGLADGAAGSSARAGQGASAAGSSARAGQGAGAAGSPARAGQGAGAAGSLARAGQGPGAAGSPARAGQGAGAVGSSAHGGRRTDAAGSSPRVGSGAGNSRGASRGAKSGSAGAGRTAGAGLRAAAEQARAAVERGEVQVKAPPAPSSTAAPIAIPSARRDRAGAPAPTPTAELERTLNAAPHGAPSVASGVASSGSSVSSGAPAGVPQFELQRGEISPSIRAEIADAIAGRNLPSAPDNTGHQPSTATSGAPGLGAKPVTPAPGAIGHQPSPAANTGAASHQPSPAASTGAASHQPSPATGTDAAGRQPSPAASTGAASHQPSPAASTGAGSHQPSPVASTDAAGRRPSPVTAIGAASHEPTLAASTSVTGHQPSPAASAGAAGRQPSPVTATGAATSHQPTLAASTSVTGRQPSPGATTSAPGLHPKPATPDATRRQPKPTATAPSAYEAPGDPGVDFDPLFDPDTLAVARGLRERFVGTLFGLAVGDAVAAATQFRRPGTFAPVGDMLGGGPFDLPRGAWSDDTAMALCLAESLLECDGFDARDQVQRYSRWQQDGYLTSTGQCVGITASTARSLALAKWRRGLVFPGSHDPDQIDPEPLSRIASIALFYFSSLDETLLHAADSARITCQASAVLDACKRLGGALNAAVSGQPKTKILAEAGPLSETASQTNTNATTALSAAFWAFGSTDNFRDAILRAANVGGNSDVVACVCGQIAGAHYGATAIPPSWRSGLMQKDLIEGIADRLLAHALVSLSS